MAVETEDLTLDDDESPIADETVEPVEGIADDEEPEFSIELEGEVAEDETPLIKQLREKTRDQERELAEYRKKAMPKIEVGERPTLEGMDWDEDKFADALLQWTDRKRAADNQDAEASQKQEVHNREQQRRFADYRAAAAALPVKDFAEVEATVFSSLVGDSGELVGKAILNYTKDPAKVLYALGKHPEKLRAVIAEPDPIKGILMLNDIERNLKVTIRNKPPAPESETIQRGSAPASSSSSKKLDELEKEAAKTTDRTKIIAWKSAQKGKNK